MRKISIFLLLIAAMALQFCSSTKNPRSTASAPEKITYSGKVQQIMTSNCQPCHFPPKGNKKAYDTYTAVKGDIDEILSRIQRNPGDRGFMPFKHPKLPDSTIQAFIQWKADGLLEK